MTGGVPLEEGFVRYDGGYGKDNLADLAIGLLEQQKERWPALAEGCRALAKARTREIRGAGWTIKVQFNPQRIVSSGASVDPESIRRRPCFLCANHRPREQRAILYRGDYLVLCNPMPIFPGHWTIAHRSHLPQSLRGNMASFLGLARDFGSGMVVLYNGPHAGASAPDHLHFQAAPAGLMPVEEESLDPRKKTGSRHLGGVEIFRVKDLARGLVVIDGKDEGEVAAAAGAVVDAFGRLFPSGDEPMLNLICRHTTEGWRLLLFPRRKHRPDAYARDGEDGLLISPGAVDMGGMIITPRERDFLALTPARVSGIFREVALDGAEVDALLNAL